MAGEKRHLLLTGGKGAGKSVLLRRLLEGRALAGGFVTLRRRTPFGGEIYLLPPEGEGPCGGENLLFVKNRGAVENARFDTLGVSALETRRGEGVLVMDELGLAEESSPRFRQAVLDCLEGTVPVYGVVQRGESIFLDRVRQHPAVRLAEVTAANREALYRLLRAEGW